MVRALGHWLRQGCRCRKASPARAFHLGVAGELRFYNLIIMGLQGWQVMTGSKVCCNSGTFFNLTFPVGLANLHTKSLELIVVFKWISA